MKRTMTTLSIAAAAAVLTTAVWAADPMTKDQAIEKALQTHPGGEVIKAYQETKQGVDTWEVKLKASDGTTWEIYYAIADGTLLKAERDD